MTNTATSTPPRTRLKAAIVPVNQLITKEKTRMFELMQDYYQPISTPAFLSDLSKKDAVIMLKDRSGAIQGFSTLVTFLMKVDGRPLRAVFSGDTVIDRRYWGQRVLGKAFLRYLFTEKIKSPFEPLYWLLISKGYRTYLMMANNFAEHHPRFEKPMPPRARWIRDLCYSTLYPVRYDSTRGVIEAGADGCRLKPSVARISAVMLKSNPRIAFFEQCNPDWREGTELACIARMTLLMPFRYALKVIVRDRLIKPLAALGRYVLPHSQESDQDVG